MAIFGSKVSLLKSTRLKQEICLYCEQDGKMIGSVFSKYIHVYNVPIFPVSKRVVAQCMCCKKLWKLEEMNPELKKNALQLLSQKVPTRHYLGSISLAALLVVSACFHLFSGKNSGRYLSNPLVETVHQLKMGEKYSTNQMEVVQGDQILPAK